MTVASGQHGVRVKQPKGWASAVSRLLMFAPCRGNCCQVARKRNGRPTQGCKVAPEYCQWNHRREVHKGAKSLGQQSLDKPKFIRAQNCVQNLACLCQYRKRMPR